MAEALILDPQAQLHIEQPDMAAFEAEFSEHIQQAPEHVCSVGCDHYHADVHIDHPEEDRTHAATEAHEAGHVHGPGCGHAEHEQAHEHIDRHVHSESCRHLHHGDAKEHIDHSRIAKAETHHHEAEHVHHAGCGHVGYEKAQAHVDKPHVHDAHCGHLHHAEADTQVDHAVAPKHDAHDHDHGGKEHVHHPGCGHVGYERAHEEYADHKKVHHHDHIGAAVRVEMRKVAEHNHEQEVATRHYLEVGQPKAYDRHTEAEHVQHEHVVAVQQKRRIPDPLEARVNEDMEGMLSRYTEKAVDADAMKLPGQTVVSDPTAKERRIEGSDELSAISMSEAAEIALAQSEEGVSEQPRAHTNPVEMIKRVTPVEAIIPPQPEATLNELAIAGELEPTDAPSELIGSVSLQEVGTKPLFSAAKEAPEPLDVPVARLPEIVGQGDTLAAVSDIANVVVDQIQTVESELAMVSPERWELVRATIAKLRANLADDARQEILPAEVHKEFIELLQQLGFASPEQTLGMYLSQYGYNFLDDLLLRLFELLSKSASFETSKLHMPILTTQQSQTTSSMVIGKFVLQLLTAAQSRLARADMRIAHTNGQLPPPGIAI